MPPSRSGRSGPRPRPTRPAVMDWCIERRSEWPADAMRAAAATSVPLFSSEEELLGVAVALGARSIATWTDREEALVTGLPSADKGVVGQCRALIRAGHDPLGEAFCCLRSPEERRPRGATYTPLPIVAAMLAWSAGRVNPARVVDPGVGSARFLMQAGRCFPGADLVGVDVDPTATVIARANLAATGVDSGRVKILVEDYRTVRLPQIEGRTLFLGNPPYVRHHQLTPDAKGWLRCEAARHGFQASQLAGLHVYFFLATVNHGFAGDVGCYITSAEWLDVNYGQLVRDLFVGPLGGESIDVVEPTAQPFPDAATTAAISCFELGAVPPSIRLRRVEKVADLGALETGDAVHRERLETETRWSPLTRPGRQGPDGFVELGELCRVHRGQVTGANRVWIAGAHSEGLPSEVMYRTVTKARELFASGGVLLEPSHLRQVIDIPPDLDALSQDAKRRVEKFLRLAERMGAASGYVARTRRAWWSVGLRAPAPVLATYMARRPPAFVRNLAEARHINIAHGLYPRVELDGRALTLLARYLSKSVALGEGRVYAGGLTKFEPKEMERLLVPGPDLLRNPDYIESAV